MTETNKLTIRDIAHLAGVSKATVSRVLNNKPDVDAHTRERILHLIEEHHFTPDLSARQLGSHMSSGSRSVHTPFPSDFLWGAATSAFQIEGAVDEDGRSPSIWDAFARQPGAIYRGETAKTASDHYHRMQEDVNLMETLNLRAYRFSLAWPRILPDGRGTINQRGLDFYDRLVDALLTKHICPVATLYHWDLPQALQEQGGWRNRETAEAFAEYTGVVAHRLGDRISWWITLNEPWCSAYLSYGVGMHAPGEHDMQGAVNAGHHLLLAHARAVTRLRGTVQGQTRIGITLNLTPIYAADDGDAAQEGVERADVLNNRWFLDPLFRGAYPARLFADMGVHPPPGEEADMQLISTPLDFLGVNYYSRALIGTRRHVSVPQGTSEAYEQIVPVPGASYTHMAWEIYPRGVRDVLQRVWRDYAPPLILLTENGAAFDDRWDGANQAADTRRRQFLHDHIQELEEALVQGVPLGGYFVWSLLDNFEWADGYSKRFGLVYVDYATQRRIIKESGHWYAAFITTQPR